MPSSPSPTTTRVAIRSWRGKMLVSGWPAQGRREAAGPIAPGFRIAGTAAWP
jgi:hypothetical protein